MYIGIKIAYGVRRSRAQKKHLWKGASERGLADSGKFKPDKWPRHTTYTRWPSTINNKHTWNEIILNEMHCNSNEYSNWNWLIY